MKLKKYIKGFLKGSVFLIISLTLFGTIRYMLYGLDADYYPIDILFWISGLILIGYLTRKYKLPNGWMVVSLLFTFYMLPFLFGYIESNNEKSV